MRRFQLHWLRLAAVLGVAALCQTPVAAMQMATPAADGGLVQSARLVCHHDVRYEYVSAWHRHAWVYYDRHCDPVEAPPPRSMHRDSHSHHHCVWVGPVRICD